VVRVTDSFHYCRSEVLRSTLKLNSILYRCADRQFGMVYEKMQQVKSTFSFVYFIIFLSVNISTSESGSSSQDSFSNTGTAQGNAINSSTQSTNRSTTAATSITTSVPVETTTQGKL